MKELPDEIVSFILSFVENPRPITNGIIKYLIYDCYEEDYDPYTAETWRDNFCYEYSFYEWYFMYRRKMNNNIYEHTPETILIGSDRIIIA